MTRWTDGGLATTLQAAGLAAFTPVTDWLVEHPERVVAAHRAFVEAGAEVLLAGTFGLRPGARPDARLRFADAVRLAREAGPAAVFSSHAPGGSTQDWAALAAWAREEGVDGLVLETFTEPEELWEALGAVRAAWPGAQLVGSLSPRGDGALWSGAEPEPALRRALAAGADLVGFNCGLDPRAVERAAARSPSAQWARPGANADSRGLAAEVLARLAERVRWVGGCCGVGPAEVAAARTAWYMARPTQRDPSA